MDIEKIYGFVTPASKNETHKQDVNGKEIGASEKLYGILSEIFSRVESKCDIPIKFLSINGTQNNPVLLKIKDLDNSFSYENVFWLADLLSNCTDKTMKKGLFFIAKMKDGNKSRIALCRIPAEEGITVKSEKSNLQFDVLEDVFIKNSHKFKLAFFDSVDDFMEGKATDKQINDTKKIRYLSDYWVKDFLSCELTITPKRGTKMLAEAIRKTIEVTENETVQKELTSVIPVIQNVNTQKTSFDGFFSLMHLSEETKNEVLQKLTINPTVQFQIDSEEFNNTCTYQFMIMDNGAIAIAPSNEFNSIWTIEKKQEKVLIKSFGTVVKTKYKQKV